MNHISPLLPHLQPTNKSTRTQHYRCELLLTGWVVDANGQRNTAATGVNNRGSKQWGECTGQAENIPRTTRTKSSDGGPQTSLSGRPKKGPKRCPLHKFFSFSFHFIVTN